MAETSIGTLAKPIPETPTDRDYQAQGDRPLIAALADPLALFNDWLADAKAAEISDANAMALATVDTDGFPDVRIVLLKDFSAAGFTFYTNHDSAKGRQLDGQGKAAVNFHWKSLARQVRIRGTVRRGDPADADAYFATRARDSQIGAWASHQSRALPDREALLARHTLLTDLYREEDTIPRPPHWGGYILEPVQIEFWQDQAYRLHDRVTYTRAPETGWAHERLNP
ncbi:MAG: pyridoxamine 5'-phosphate oxidase [Pseudomonadota bacterium]